MKKTTREALARGLAARMTAVSCAELMTQWTQWERDYKRARQGQRIHPSLWRALDVCATCALTASCAELAHLTRYTGIAAGQIYRNGHPEQVPSHGSLPAEK